MYAFGAVGDSGLNLKHINAICSQWPVLRLDAKLLYANFIFGGARALIVCPIVSSWRCLYLFLESRNGL
jgi:hypothetical protein